MTAINKMNVSKLLVITLVTSGCSSMSFKEKILTNMLIGGAVGYLAGQKKEEYKNQNSAMYAGAGASVAAVLTTLIENPDEKNKKLSEELKSLHLKYDNAFNPKPEFTGSGMMNSKIPEKYRSMISPGEWKVYSVDQWVEDGENRLIHQDKLMELIPPSLKPASLPTQIKKGE